MIFYSLNKIFITKTNNEVFAIKIVFKLSNIFDNKHN